MARERRKGKDIDRIPSNPTTSKFQAPFSMARAGAADHGSAKIEKQAPSRGLSVYLPHPTTALPSTLSEHHTEQTSIYFQ